MDRRARRVAIGRNHDPLPHHPDERTRAARDAGADTLVAGTAIFGAPDYAAAIAALRAQPKGGTA